MTTIVEMRGISKSFPGIKANDRVDLAIETGEIHVLLGENGAGKTTLMNILYGHYQPDEGEILVRGRPVAIDNPNIALKLGIGMVHQHFMLVPPLTVVENIVLGTEPSRHGWLDLAKAIRDVSELSRQYELAIDPLARIETISVGMQQRVEILKMLYRGADILILDEPTAVLTPQEIVEFGRILKQLVQQGKSIILITHKLREVMQMSQRVTIIRRGRIIDTLATAQTSIAELAEKMVGRQVRLTVDKTLAQPGEAILTVRDIRAHDSRGLESLKGVNFTVRRGEIFGIAGVDGNGQQELIEVITGLRSPQSGQVTLGPADITGQSPRAIRAAGLAYIPEDRHKRGLILDYSLAENSILGQHRRPEFRGKWGLSRAKIQAFARKLMAEFDVRAPHERVKARTLSGGNQQKFIIARELSRQPQLLIAAQPTRGLDVGAIEFVHQRLIEERDQGKGVLLISLELDEIMNVADRIAVIYDGRIVGELLASSATEQQLGLLMAGGSCAHD